MDRKLIVILLKKHIQELEMITEGFMEMTTYPKPIVALARKKTEDILDYISELENLKPEITPVNSTNNEDFPREDNNISTVDKIEESAEVTVETTVTETIEEEVTTTYKEIEPLKQEEKIVNSEEPILGSSENDAENEKDNLYSETEEDEFEEEDDEFEEEEDEFEEDEDFIEEEIFEDETEELLEVKVEEIVSTGSVTTVKKEKVTVQTTEVEKNTTVADSHNNKKIDDIRHAISIGDRFRFQRELFGGNGEVLNKTLSYLNQLGGFEEAHTYLKNKFKWNEEDETVESFYQIIKRRYL